MPLRMSYSSLVSRAELEAGGRETTELQKVIQIPFGAERRCIFEVPCITDT